MLLIPRQHIVHTEHHYDDVRIEHCYDCVHVEHHYDCVHVEHHYDCVHVEHHYDCVHTDHHYDSSIIARPLAYNRWTQDMANPASKFGDRLLGYGFKSLPNLKKSFIFPFVLLPLDTAWLS